MRANRKVCSLLLGTDSSSAVFDTFITLVLEYSDIRKECHEQKRKITPSMEKYIREKITVSLWSPQQICDQAKLVGVVMVSHERVYQLIREDKMHGGTLWKHTRHEHKCRIEDRRFPLCRPYPTGLPEPMDLDLQHMSISQKN
jgi:hypothetical protein